MPRVKYDNVMFDSELEVEYYKLLLEQNKGKEVVDFIYHPEVPIQINNKNKYTPDFIVTYADRIEIIETKGFNQFSYMRDNIIHNVMLEKTTDDLISYLYDNGFKEEDIKGKDVIYRKIKYLKTFGWVDFNFKNPNTLANKRKEKLKEKDSEIKELRNYKKNAERYFSYENKITKGEKLTKQQKLWYLNFKDEYIYKEER